MKYNHFQIFDHFCFFLCCVFIYKNSETKDFFFYDLSNVSEEFVTFRVLKCKKMRMGNQVSKKKKKRMDLLFVIYSNKCKNK